jgi:hypothetical protein
MYLGERAADLPGLAAGVCTFCHMRSVAAALPASDLDAIRVAAECSTLAAVKEARERLGWSLREAILLVHAMCGAPEPGTVSDSGI